MSKQRTPQLIGLAGGRGAGKDTVAGLLVTHHGFHQHAFADALRDFLYATDEAWALSLDIHGYDYSKRQVGGFRKRIDQVGQAARDWISTDVWVDALAGRVRHSFHTGHSVVVSDVRYQNEADVIRDMGGIVLGIDRPHHNPADEQEAWDVFLNADDYLMNHEGIDSLADQLAKYVSDV